MYNISLLVVVKNEDNQIYEKMKELVDRDDDNGDIIVGTKDGTVRTVKCTESEWVSHKKSGHADLLADKFLFIDVTKEIVKPDRKYDKYGVSYGYEGNVFVLYIDDKYVWTNDKYEAFLNELKVYAEENEIKAHYASKDNKPQNAKKNLLFAAGALLFPPVAIAGAVKGTKSIVNAINDKKELRKQMIMFGIYKLYYDELDVFIRG